MEIRVLRYFIVIAKEKSITKAANTLHITQPTLSRQIKDLEEELGQKLFERKSHKVVLTKEGIILYKRAEEIISMVDKTEAEFNSMKNIVSGDVYIGGGETIAIRTVAKVIKSIRDKCPDIHFNIYSGNAYDVTEKIDKGLLDFGVLIQPADISKYNYLRIKDEDIWGVVMRKDSPLAEKDFIEKNDLISLPLICSKQAISNGLPENKFKEWFGDEFSKLNIIATFNLVYNAAIMAEAGIGYVITLDKLVNTEETSNICFRPLKPELKANLDIVWKKNQVFSPAAELFLEELKNSLS